MKILRATLIPAAACVLFVAAIGRAQQQNASKPATSPTTTTTTPKSGQTTTSAPSALPHHEFHSATLDSLSHSETGQANGRGAPSSSHEYDNAKHK